MTTLTLILSFACMIGVGAFITLALCAVASRADDQMEELSGHRYSG